MDKWQVLKEKVTSMIEVEKTIGTEEARKAYHRILEFMKDCEDDDEYYDENVKE
jgi:AAA+ superfamily predicted ATPase